jgi:hypothetical protein
LPGKPYCLLVKPSPRTNTSILMEASSPSEQEAWYNAIEAEMFVFFVSTIREILSVYLFFMLGR